MGLDPSADWTIFQDGIETITLFLRTDDGDPPTTGGVSVENALRRALKKDELANPAWLHRETTVWHLWTAKLGGTVPRKGFVVQQASGKRWTVEEADLETLSTRWKLTCTAEV